jgi:hypothetical protein
MNLKENLKVMSARRGDQFSMLKKTVEVEDREWLEITTLTKIQKCKNPSRA